MAERGETVSQRGTEERKTMNTMESMPEENLLDADQSDSLGTDEDRDETRPNEDSIAIYMKDVSQTPLLTPRQQHELGKQMEIKRRLQDESSNLSKKLKRSPEPNELAWQILTALTECSQQVNIAAEILVGNADYEDEIYIDWPPLPVNPTLLQLVNNTNFLDFLDREAGPAPISPAGMAVARAWQARNRTPVMERRHVQEIFRAVAVPILTAVDILPPQVISILGDQTLPQLARKRNSRVLSEIKDNIETEMHQLAEQLESARNIMVQANLRLVVKQALAASRINNNDPGDLVQEGNMGLMRAAEKFDHRLGNRFTSYAMWWIRQAVNHESPRKSRMIHIPSHILKEHTKLRTQQRELTQTLGREPNVQELAKALNVTVDRILEIEQTIPRMTSLDNPIDEDMDLKDILPNTNDPDPSDAVFRRVMRQEVQRALDSLSPVQAMVLRMRFGLDGQLPATPRETGRELGLNKEQVKRVETEALKELKELQQSKKLRDFL